MYLKYLYNIYIYICIRMYACMYVCMHACMCMYVYVCVYIYVYIHIHICIYMYVCTYVCMYMHIMCFALSFWDTGPCGHIRPYWSMDVGHTALLEGRAVRRELGWL